MPGTGSNWHRLLDAACRKIEIARFHLLRLQEELNSSELQISDRPPISVQAHFEGLLVSVIAAIDQVAKAVIEAEGLKNQRRTNEAETAFDHLGKLIPFAQEWFAEPIGRDLRRIRTRIVHYSYVKSSNEAMRLWKIESAGQSRDYAGSRELMAYARAGADYGERLRMLVKDIRNRLPSNTAESKDNNSIPTSQDRSQGAG